MGEDVQMVVFVLAQIFQTHQLGQQGQKETGLMKRFHSDSGLRREKHMIQFHLDALSRQFTGQFPLLRNLFLQSRIQGEAVEGAKVTEGTEHPQRVLVDGMV
jgi:hypothetical protein